MGNANGFMIRDDLIYEFQEWNDGGGGLGKGPERIIEGGGGGVEGTITIEERNVN